jgi:D-alanine-D-alanine ligase
MGNQTHRAAKIMTRVAVLLGGRSAERKVSLVSGRACAQALRDEGFEVAEIDAGADLAERLHREKPDAVLNALHGRWGEDGCVQGLLELLQIPYSHSGVLASALAMHKERAKTVFRAAGLPVAHSVVAERQRAASEHQIPPPYVVKPICEGSSVGVFIIREGDNRPPAALGSTDWNLGDEVMVEEYIPGRELTVAVMGAKTEGLRALGVTEILPATGFYDYDAKYAPGGSRHVIPAEIPDVVMHEAMALAERAHAALECRGVSRTDFRYDDSGGKDRLVVLELNTQPGMTPTSLVPEQALYNGMSFRALVRWMVEDASCGR